MISLESKLFEDYDDLETRDQKESNLDVLDVLKSSYESHQRPPFDTFYAEQLQTIKDDSGYAWAKGYEISKFYGNLGYLFVYLGILALLFTFVKRFRQVSYFVVLSYPILFFLIFLNKPSRLYFYIPIIPYVAIAIGIFLKDYSSKFSKSILYLILVLIIAQPSYILIKDIQQKRIKSDYKQLHTGLLATEWAKQNIFPSSKMIYYGYYVNLPQLVDENPENNANLGEFFMYHRYNYEFLKEHYNKAYTNYVQNGGKTYSILNIRYDLKQQEPGLFNYCMQNKIQYVITTYNLNIYPSFAQKYYQAFEKNKKVTYGSDIYVYKLF